MYDTLNSENFIIHTEIYNIRLGFLLEKILCETNTVSVYQDVIKKNWLYDKQMLKQYEQFNDSSLPPLNFCECVTSRGIQFLPPKRFHFICGTMQVVREPAGHFFLSGDGEILYSIQSWRKGYSAFKTKGFADFLQTWINNRDIIQSIRIGYDEDEHNKEIEIVNIIIKAFRGKSLTHDERHLFGAPLDPFSSAHLMNLLNDNKATVLAIRKAHPHDVAGLEYLKKKHEEIMNEIEKLLLSNELA